MSDFERALKQLLNKYSQENHSNTPDWILANYINISLNVLNQSIHDRDEFYGVHLKPGMKIEEITDMAFDMSAKLNESK
jgi:hypothetical protein